MKRKNVLGWAFVKRPEPRRSVYGREELGASLTLPYGRLVTRPVLLGPGSAINVSISGYLLESSLPYIKFAGLLWA